MKNKKYPLYNAKYFKNLRDFSTYCNEKYSNNFAYGYEKNGELIKKTYKEFFNEVKYLGTKLISMVGKNSKIAILGANSYEWILSYFAISCSGNIVVPIDKELQKEQIEFIISETETNAIIYSDNYKEIADSLNIPKNISIESELDVFVIEGREMYKTQAHIYDNIKLKENDISTIIYTSGTTGIAKGVMLTQKNLCTNIANSSKNLLLPGDAVLVLPLHHTFALTANVLCMLNIGYTVYINKSLKYVTKDLQKYKPSVMFVVPMIVEAFYKRIWASAKESKKDKLLKIMIKISNMLLICGIDIRKKLFKSVIDGFGGKLELVICGGAALDSKYVKGFRDIGINLLNGYGITECSPIVSVNRNEYYRDGSVGTPLEGVEIKIERKDSEREGEILVKGDIVMKGYFNHDDKTSESMTSDGYFKTGDIGYLDENNFLYITGRIKNLIILDNGKNIYPEELELELLHNDGIKEVVVYSLNNAIVAEIFPDFDYLKEKDVQDTNKYFEEVIERYNSKHPMYKQINKFTLREVEFEKTTTKKIKRNY